MKLAYLSPTGSLGGAEFCLLDLLASARSTRPGWEQIVLLGGDGPLRAEIEALGIRCDVLPLPSRLAQMGDSGLIGQGRLARLARLGIGVAKALAGTLRYGRRLRTWIGDIRPDLIHSNGMKMHVLSAWASPRSLPVVWQLHDYLGSRPAMAKLLRASIRPRLSAVAVSRSVARDAASVLGPRVPVHPIHNRIDLDRFHPGNESPGRLDQAAGFPPAEKGTVRVGLVATFANWKGHELFLEAVARIPRDPPARFYIVGGPIYQSAGSQVTFDELKARIEALGIGDRVALTGHVGDTSATMRALDVVVHASTRPEPFGRVIVEAMACGRSVVAMDEGGAAELIEDGRTAVACPPRDPVALADAIHRLILEPETRRRLGESGHRAAYERFDRTRLADDWEPIYRSAIRPLVANPVESHAAFALRTEGTYE